jgi:hypothetical protein
MQRTAIATGTVSSIIVLLVVLTLAIGFGADLAQALSQAAPIILATGIAIGLGTLVLHRELA